MYGVKGEKLQRQYKNKLSGFKSWDAKEHAEQWLIYPENVTEALSIDEVALSGGELYTIVTSKSARARKDVWLLSYGIHWQRQLSAIYER